MSVVNSVRGKTAGPPQFWWEDGYDPSAVPTTATVQSRIRYDAEGETFELAKYTTDLCHLDAHFFHNDNTIVSLRHLRNRSASIALFSFNPDSNCSLVPRTIYDIGDNSGYMALSHDDKILAVGILKEDSISIFDVQTGELLVNVCGGYKLGFWGRLQFLPGNFNNTFLEVRAISMDKGKVKESVVRSWDLGFRPSSDGNSDLDEDEDATKLWETKRRGNMQCIRSNDKIVCATNAMQKLEWLDATSGGILRQLSFDSWIGKPIISSCGRYIAISQFGCCSVFDFNHGTLLSKITCPDMDSTYPLIPLVFLHNDEWLLCRINQERALLLTVWQKPTPHSSAYIRHVGGTITDDAVRISRDEKFLLCWPYGVLELYDFQGMKDVLQKKLRRNMRWELVKLRYLYENSRVVLRDENSLEPMSVQLLENDIKKLKLDDKDSKKKGKKTGGILKKQKEEVAPPLLPLGLTDAEKRDRKLLEFLIVRLTTPELFHHMVCYI